MSVSNFKQFKQANVQESDKMSSFNKSKTFPSSGKSGNWRDSASTTTTNSGMGRTTETDGWSHVGKTRADKPQQRNSNYGGNSAAGGAGYAPRPASDRPYKPNLFKTTKIVDDIMETSGDLRVIERRLTEYIKSRPSKEEKAKVLETVISYSLHELLDCEFIRELVEQMSVNSALYGNQKDVVVKDGYDVFHWAVWPRFVKRPITNIPRKEDDVITTVGRLIAMGLSPFRVNVKEESIFMSMQVAVEKKLLSPATASIISTMILGIDDTELIMKLLRGSFAVIFTESEKAKFEKSVLLWGVTRPGMFEILANYFFDLDVQYCSSVEIDRPNAKLYMTANCIKFLELMKSGSGNTDLASYFAKNPITGAMVTTMASSIINKFFGVIDRIEECSIDGVYDPTSTRILYKSLHAFGGIVGELSKYVPGFALTEEQSAKMCNKMKIGFAMASATNTPAWKTFIDTIYTDASTKMTQKIEIENLRTRLGMVETPVKPVAPATRQTKVQTNPVVKAVSSFTVLESWEDACEEVDETEKTEEVNPYSGKVTISLNKLKTADEVEVRDGALYPCYIEDNVYSLSELAKKHDKSTHHKLVYEMLVVAGESVYQDNHIRGFMTMVNHLNTKGILEKSLFKSVLEEKEEEIRDMSDNPKISKVLAAFKAGF